MRQTAKQIIETIKSSKNSHEVIPTGFPRLDQQLDGGFFSKELVVLGAHTGVGKSQIAGQIAITNAYEGFKTAYFSLEISNEMVLSRMVGAMTNIKPTMIRFGNLTKEEHEARVDTETGIVALGDLMSFYDDLYTLDEIVKEIKTHKFDFVVIDFIQNIMDRVSDEYTRMSKAALTLQKLAKDTGACILVLSQLSNTAAKEGNRSKTLEYKGSGSIAMVADLGFFLERPNTSTDDYDPEMGTWLTLKKNRRGISGMTFQLGFTQPGGQVYVK